jgi:hypothetical protein
MFTDSDLIEVVSALGDNAYVVTIEEALTKRGITASYGAIYVALDRLLESGRLHCHSEPGGAERGFRNRLMWTTPWKQS